MSSLLTDKNYTVPRAHAGRPRKANVEGAASANNGTLPPVPTEGVTGDPLKLYLREMSRHDLLTPAEEIALNKIKERGGNEGHEAYEKMVNSNLRLVVKIARDYEDYGLPLLDLINEGNMGLMKAIEKFDHRRGAKISTYASWWIKQSIKRALANQGKTIRLPVHAVDKFLRLKKLSSALEESLGRPPSVKELHEESGIPEKTIQSLFDTGGGPISLQTEVSSGGEETATIADFIADPNALMADAEASGSDQRQRLTKFLTGLKPRERTVLELRFGLLGDDELTLEEVGKRFKVTRERIRQIEAIALRKIRNRTARQEIGVTSVSLSLKRPKEDAAGAAPAMTLPRPSEYIPTLIKFWVPPAASFAGQENAKKVFLEFAAEVARRGFSGAAIELAEVCSKSGIDRRSHKNAIRHLTNPEDGPPLIAPLAGSPGKFILTVEGYELFQAGASNPECRAIYLEALRSQEGIGRFWTDPVSCFKEGSQLEIVFKALGELALRQGERIPFSIKRISGNLKGIKVAPWLKTLSGCSVPGGSDRLADFNSARATATLSEPGYSLYLRGFSEVCFEAFRAPRK